jgi:hypothetical protein
MSFDFSGLVSGGSTHVVTGAAKLNVPIWNSLCRFDTSLRSRLPITALFNSALQASSLRARHCAIVEHSGFISEHGEAEGA